MTITRMTSRWQSGQGGGFSAMTEIFFNADHLDGFTIPENDELVTDPDAPVMLDEDGEPVAQTMTPERLDKAAFATSFNVVLSVPGALDPDFRPIAVQPEETDQARAASDALYDLLEIWYPSALTPNSATIGNLMIVAPFIFGKAMIARAIIADKRARRMTPPPMQAANDAGEPNVQNNGGPTSERQ